MKKIINHWLKWTVLSDNRSDDSRLSTEHGLSIFLQTTNEREQCDACINIAERGGVRRSQTERHKILLDTGASDVFIRNAEQLGINLGDVDYVFISHGHSDHAGGLRYFLGHNQKAQVIVSPDAMSGKYFSKRGNLHSITTEWPSHRLIPCPREIRISMFRMLMAIISTMTSATNWPCMSMACYSRAVLIADWRIFWRHVLGLFILL